METSLANLKIKKQHLVSSSPNTSIEKALELLKKFNITSMPILSHKRDHFIGIISVFEIVVYLLKHKDFSHHIESALSLNSGDESFFLIKVDAQDLLKEVMQHLKVYHRVLVHDKEELYLLSQSDVVRYLVLRNVNPALTTKRMLDLLPTRQITKLNVSVTAKEGFQKLKSSNHLALPIVDENDKFLHVLSASDLRGINRQNFHLIDLNILEFLKQVKKAEPHTAGMSTSLGEVMQFSVENLSHRAFILDGDRKIINVVSLTDIIKLFLF